METKELLRLAVNQAQKTMSEGLGGPFGACIIDPDGKVYVSSNTVLGSHDPTAHAEVNVIREACRKKGTHDLTGCILYTSCYPCPMCLSAIIWANIKEVYYGASPEDAAKIGFRDDAMYRFINTGCVDDKVLKLHEAEEKGDCIQLFDQYAKEEKNIY